MSVDRITVCAMIKLALNIHRKLICFVVLFDIRNPASCHSCILICNPAVNGTRNFKLSMKEKSDENDSGVDRITRIGGQTYIWNLKGKKYFFKNLNHGMIKFNVSSCINNKNIQKYHYYYWYHHLEIDLVKRGQEKTVFFGIFIFWNVLYEILFVVRQSFSVP